MGMGRGRGRGGAFAHAKATPPRRGLPTVHHRPLQFVDAATTGCHTPRAAAQSTRAGHDEGERDDIHHAIPPPFADDVPWQLKPRQLVETDRASPQEDPDDRPSDDGQNHHQREPSDMEAPSASCAPVGFLRASHAGDGDDEQNEHTCDEYDRRKQHALVLHQLGITPPPGERHARQHGHADEARLGLSSCSRHLPLLLSSQQCTCMSSWTQQNK